MNIKAHIVTDDVVEESLNTRWEQFFSEVLDNKNLSVKDVETAKFVFFSGASALMELLDSNADSAEDRRDEITAYLGDDSEDDWAVFHAKESNGKADSKQG